MNFFSRLKYGWKLTNSLKDDRLVVDLFDTYNNLKPVYLDNPPSSISVSDLIKNESDNINEAFELGFTYGVYAGEAIIFRALIDNTRKTQLAQASEFLQIESDRINIIFDDLVDLLDSVTEDLSNTKKIMEICLSVAKTNNEKIFVAWMTSSIVSSNPFIAIMNTKK